LGKRNDQEAHLAGEKNPFSALERLILYCRPANNAVTSKNSARATDQGQTVIVSSAWAGIYVDLLHSVLGAFEYQKLECSRGDQSSDQYITEG